MPSPTFSRYTGAANIIDESRFNRTVIKKNASFRRYTCVANDRLTTLAWKFLGDAQYWWVLAEVNDLMEIDFLFGVMPAGYELMIPSLSILGELTGVQSNQSS